MRVKDAYERKLLQEEVLPVQKEPRLKRQLWIWRTGLGSCRLVGPAALALALLFVALQATSRLLLRVGRRGKGIAVQEQLCKALAAGRYLLPYARYRTRHTHKKVLFSSHQHNVSSLLLSRAAEYQSLEQPCASWMGKGSGGLREPMQATEMSSSCAGHAENL